MPKHDVPPSLETLQNGAAVDVIDSLACINLTNYHAAPEALEELVRPEGNSRDPFTPQTYLCRHNCGQRLPRWDDRDQYEQTFRNAPIEKRRLLYI